ncbi:MAG: nitrogenase iron-molybdenum cofactor biosynthesis protein NifN [Rhodospirillaceae bacterium]|nr:nitrogenase iron-molybdenum cofactor biosynthesis protein NifN [Rhodospirillaceae bacterium]
MTEIVKRNKALSVNPLKASSTLGAALAFMGMDRCVPMIHGSQGCTAFGKIFFIQHFQEPIPLQTTALDQIGTVMGSYENLIEGLHTLAGQAQPAMIGVPTSGLAEVQGFDVSMGVREFRAAHPEHDAIKVVPVTTPDYRGALESGFAQAVTEIIRACVPDSPRHVGERRRQINVLVGASLTPGDIEYLKETIEAFGLRPVVVPDISDSLDGHLAPESYTPCSTGGPPINEMETLGLAVATLVIGASMADPADELRRRTGVPDIRFDHICGLDASDALIMTLRDLSGQDVPERIDRQRAQFLDAMLDTHFMMGFTRVAIAADPDLLVALAALIKGTGAEVTTAVTPIYAPVLTRSGLSTVKIGDLEDLDIAARETEAEILITNSHGVAVADRLGIPLYRAGFPQFHWFGGFAKVWVGYRGGRQALFDLANILTAAERGEIHPYRSVYGQKPEYRAEAKSA